MFQYEDLYTRNSTCQSKGLFKISKCCLIPPDKWDSKKRFLKVNPSAFPKSPYMGIYDLYAFSTKLIQVIIHNRPYSFKIRKIVIRIESPIYRLSSNSMLKITIKNIQGAEDEKSIIRLRKKNSRKFSQLKNRMPVTLQGHLITHFVIFSGENLITTQPT